MSFGQRTIATLVVTASLLYASSLSATGLRVVGTELQLLDASGEYRSASQLLGAELELSDLGSIRILAVERDSTARFDDIWLHTLQLRGLGETLYSGFCEPDPAGDERVVLYPGYLDDAGRYVADPDRFSMSCVSGVEAKCLRWGYAPWRSAPFSGEPLGKYFESCIRLARADYCGDGRPNTRDGTLIDVYDRVGVQQAENQAGELSFEAGWNRDGAVCVAHTRVPESLSLTDLAKRCSGLGGSAQYCTEEEAKARGALLFNRSKR